MNNLPEILEQKLENAYRAGELEEWPISINKQYLRTLLAEVKACCKNQ